MLSNSLLTSFQNKENNAPQYDLFPRFKRLTGIRYILKNQKRIIYVNIIQVLIWEHGIVWLITRVSGIPCSFREKHILDSCKELISGALNLDPNIPDYLDLSDKMEIAGDFNGKNFILVNISGIEKFRGPSPKTYAEIINAVNFDGELVIMDEPRRPHFEEFKKYIKRTILFIWIENFLYGELLHIASNSRLYIGSDSGISHLLQIPTNAILFFGNGS